MSTEATRDSDDLQEKDAITRLEEALPLSTATVSRASRKHDHDFRVDVGYRDNMGFVFGSSQATPLREAGFEIHAIVTVHSDEDSNRHDALHVLVSET